MRLLQQAVLLWAATPFAAFAYIDPNAGGWLFQMLFPLLVAIAGAWGLLRRRIAGVFRRWAGKREAENAAPNVDAGRDGEHGGAGSKGHD